VGFAMCQRCDDFDEHEESKDGLTLSDALIYLTKALPPTLDEV
jgi:hypothetical protein